MPVDNGVVAIARVPWVITPACCVAVPSMEPKVNQQLVAARPQAGNMSSHSCGRRWRNTTDRQLRTPHVAFCMAGEVRTFMDPTVHGNIVNDTVQALCRRECSSHVFAFLKMQRRDEDYEEACRKMATIMNASEVKAVLSKFPHATSKIVSHTHAEEEELLRSITCRRLRPRLGGKFPPLRRIVGQYLALQGSWQLMEAYEQQNQMKFDFVVRIRPDVTTRRLAPIRTLYMNALRYVDTVDHAKAPVSLVLPHARAVNGTGVLCHLSAPPVLVSQSQAPEKAHPYFVNDMLFIAPRQHARPLFNAIELMSSCPGRLGRARRYDCCAGSEALLQCALGANSGNCGKTASRTVPAGSVILLPARRFSHTVRRNRDCDIDGKGRTWHQGTVAPPLTTPPFRVECFVAYCNAHADLKDAFCGGGLCKRANADRCRAHCFEFGYNQSRPVAGGVSAKSCEGCFRRDAAKKWSGHRPTSP